MRGKPDITSFITGGAADIADREPAQASLALPPSTPHVLTPAAAPVTSTVSINVTKPEPTVQKLFRLRWDTSNALKTAAAEESAATGRRVTETEIVESMLRKRFKLAAI